jgi:CBS domain-containing protein
MKRNESITHIMTSNPEYIQIGQPLSEARKKLASSSFHHLPVVDGKKVVGMFSSTDLLRLTFDTGNMDPRMMDAVLDSSMLLKDVMSERPLTIQKSSTVREAAELLSSGSLHGLPVVDDNSQLVGIVTTTDLVKYMLDQY